MPASAKPIGAILMMAAIAWTATSVPLARSAPADNRAACWTPQQLSVTTSEPLVRKMVRAAVIDPPEREPANFNLVSPDIPLGVVRRVKLPPGRKLVALTFDLCEEPTEIAGYQGGIVDFLRANKIKATFFAGGKWMMSHDERAQQLMSDPLFQIGNHTWEHRNLRILHEHALVDEIGNAQLAYEDVRSHLEARQCLRPSEAAPASLPIRLDLIRFPFGACNPAVLTEVHRQGLTPIQWDVSSGDAPPGQSQHEMFKDVVGGVRPGSIVLFHANGRGLGTEQALPGIVKALAAKGYEFVTIGELLKAGTPEITPTCYDHKPGDTNRYDALSIRLEGEYSRARRQLESTADLLAHHISPHSDPPPNALERPRSLNADARAEQSIANEPHTDPTDRVPLPRPRPHALKRVGASRR